MSTKENYSQNSPYGQNKTLKYKVLVVPHKTGIGTEIKRSLKHSKHFEIVEDTCTKTVFEDRFTEEVTEQAKNVDFIMPAHDEAIFRLSTASEITPKLIAPNALAVEICRYKSNSYNCFPDFSPSFYPTNLNKTDYPFPQDGYFVKPNNGQGSRGCWHLKEINELDTNSFNTDDILVDYLPGKEYTMDCFSDVVGLRLVQARERVKIEKGVAVHTKLMETQAIIQPNNLILQAAQSIQSRLRMKGAWFFQMKEDSNGVPKLLEIAPRIAGSSGIGRYNNINFTELTLWTYAGYHVEPDVQLYCSELIHTQEEVFLSTKQLPKHIYVDLDDTLVINGEWNWDLWLRLVMVRNKGYKVSIITRNNTPEETIQKCGLDCKMVSPIIKVRDKSKYEFMDRNAVLIDDSWRERSEALNNLDNIYVFTPADAIEVLDNVG